MAIAPGIFRLNDIRGIVGEDLTVEAARAVGGGYAGLMRERGVSGEVAVGRDKRPGGAPPPSSAPPRCRPPPPRRARRGSRARRRPRRRHRPRAPPVVVWNPPQLARGG